MLSRHPPAGALSLDTPKRPHVARHFVIEFAVLDALGYIDLVRVGLFPVCDTTSGEQCPADKL